LKVFDKEIFTCYFLKKFSKQHVMINWNSESLKLPVELTQDIQSHWEALPQGKFFNGALVRLDTFSVDDDALTLYLSPLNYKTLLYSNAHVEKVSATWGEQYLARIVGVSVVYMSVDGYLILMKRSMHVGEFPGHIDVFGGHIDVPEHGEPDIFASMQQEIQEEMNIGADEHTLDLIALIESVPNRKPEFVFYAQSDLNYKKIGERICASQDQFEFTQVITLAKQDLPAFLNEYKQKISPSAFASLCCFNELY